jgi:hypothetical protein
MLLNGSETSSPPARSRRETLTNATSATCEPMTSAATRRRTSSPGSAGGRSRSDLPDGLTTDLFGQVRAPVRLSQARLEAKRSRTTSGPHGSPSSLQVALERLFGEQVAHKGTWLDQVCDDLDPLDYEIGAAVLPAVSVGADHARPRIYFVGHADRDREPSVRVDEKVEGLRRDRSDARGVVSADGLSARMAIFRAFGNAIVPQVAAEFVAAFSDLQ